MTDPQPPYARMIRLARRGSLSSSAHGPEATVPWGRFTSCVRDPLGQANPRPHAAQGSVI
jgi:hypothetical protein